MKEKENRKKALKKYNKTRTSTASTTNKSRPQSMPATFGFNKMYSFIVIVSATNKYGKPLLMVALSAS